MNTWVSFLKKVIDLHRYTKDIIWEVLQWHGLIPDFGDISDLCDLENYSKKYFNDKKGEKGQKKYLYLQRRHKETGKYFCPILGR